MKYTAVMLALIMLVAIISGAFPLHAFAAGEALIGDIDKDGEITVSDSLLTLRASAGLREYSDSDVPVYDVTGDRAVGVDDALGVMRCSLGMTGGFGYDGIEVTYKPNSVAKKHGVTQEIFNNTLVSAGNTARLARVMERAYKGETVNIVTLGGSITYGLYASTSQKCWAYLTYKCECGCLLACPYDKRRRGSPLYSPPHGNSGGRGYRSCQPERLASGPKHFRGCPADWNAGREDTSFRVRYLSGYQSKEQLFHYGHRCGFEPCGAKRRPERSASSEERPYPPDERTWIPSGIQIRP